MKDADKYNQPGIQGAADGGTAEDQSALQKLGLSEEVVDFFESFRKLIKDRNHDAHATQPLDLITCLANIS